MRSIFALMCAGLAVAEPLLSQERVTVTSIQQDANRLLEVDLSENMVQDDGLLVKTFAHFEVAIEEGVAIVNNEYEVPVGVAKFSVMTNVQEFVMLPEGARLASSKEVKPVTLGVASHVDFDMDGHLHLKLQILEKEGVELEHQHLASLEIMLDENNNEVGRLLTADRDVKPIAKNDIANADDVVPAPPSTVEGHHGHKKHHHEKHHKKHQHEHHDHHHGCKKLKQWYGALPLYSKIGVQFGVGFGLTLFVAFLVSMVRVCCCKPRAVKAAKATATYRKNIEASNARRAFIPIKQYKYVKVDSSAV